MNPKGSAIKEGYLIHWPTQLELWHEIGLILRSNVSRQLGLGQIRAIPRYIYATLQGTRHEDR